MPMRTKAALPAMSLTREPVRIMRGWLIFAARAFWTSPRAHCTAPIGIRFSSGTMTGPTAKEIEYEGARESGGHRDRLVGYDNPYPHAANRSANRGDSV